MKRTSLRSFGLLAFAASASAVFAQTGGGAAYDPGCWPPMADRGPSDDYIIYNLPFEDGDNQLFGVTLGINGNNNYGNQCTPNTNADFSFDVRGRVGFSIGSIGSVQSEFDNYLRMNWGMPIMVGGGTGYAMLTERASATGALTRTLFGANAIDTAFVGASDRYAVAFSNAGSFRVRLQVDLIGDAARLQWDITNTTAAPIFGGLWFGQWVVFLDQNGNGEDPTFVNTPENKPFTTPKRLRREGVTGPQDADILPMTPYVNFAASITNAYGLQLVNEPRIVNGQPDSDVTPVSEVAVGSADFLLGFIENNSPTMPDVTLDRDVPVSPGDRGYIQKWETELIPPGGTRRIVGFYRSTWGLANYARPFSVVVDAPNVINVEGENAETFEPNPFTLRVYVDNTRGYSTVDREITLNDVRVQVNLPPGMTDANDPTSSTLVARINTIAPRRMEFVDFRVRVSPETTGILPYSVQVSAPTGANKLLSGTINVATQPRLNLPASKNLVATPWRFNNTSWEAILGLEVDQDFQAFTFDPRQGEYVIQTGPQRGRGTWLLFNEGSTPPPGNIQLGGEPQSPGDNQSGAPAIALSQGWNLISNPYNYPIPLGQIVGVLAQNPGDSLTWGELVAAGAVSSAVAFYDADSPTPEYKFIQGNAALLLPNRGYWVFVQSSNLAELGTALTLEFPPVFTPFSRDTDGGPFVQSDKQWRLQLAARQNEIIDSQNFVGQARTEKDVARWRQYEAPLPPGKTGMNLYVTDVVNGKPSQLSQALVGNTGRKSFNVEVFTKTTGTTTITWPNLSTLPKNVKATITDLATNTSRNLRRTSGYTFEAEERSVRKFRVDLEIGGLARPTIGVVTASRVGRSANAPFNITYTLSSNATTTVRILNGGREIFVPVRARADRAGQNSVTWNLRDNANRSVAPGNYTVEITVESEEGERVRKFYPINVIR